ncbi:MULTISPECIES: hypothetical protein [unclassified Leptolyngbya]|nr:MULTISPECIES: hypothetical protein [unclassified Leptolyngbya]
MGMPCLGVEDAPCQDGQETATRPCQWIRLPASNKEVKDDGHGK